LSTQSMSTTMFIPRPATYRLRASAACGSGIALLDTNLLREAVAS
jgi:hypothetical protein